MNAEQRLRWVAERDELYSQATVEASTAGADALALLREAFALSDRGDVTDAETDEILDRMRALLTRAGRA